jgi:hypothetical protein
MIQNIKERENVRKTNTQIAMHTDSNQDLLDGSQALPADKSDSFVVMDVLPSSDKSESALDAASVPPGGCGVVGVADVILAAAIDIDRKKKQRLEPASEKRVHQKPIRYISSELLLPPIAGTTDYCVSKILGAEFSPLSGMKFHLEWDYRLPTGRNEKTWEPVENLLTCQPLVLDYTRANQLYCNGVTDGIAKVFSKMTGDFSYCKPGISSEEIQKMFDPFKE